MRKSHPQIEPVVGKDVETPGERSWHEDGADVPVWALALACAVAGVLVLVVVFLIALALPPTNSGAGTPGVTGVRPTPTTYGSSERERTIPDVGSRPVPSPVSLPAS